MIALITQAKAFAGWFQSLAEEFFRVLKIRGAVIADQDGSAPNPVLYINETIEIPLVT